MFKMLLNICKFFIMLYLFVCFVPKYSENAFCHHIVDYVSVYNDISFYESSLAMIFNFIHFTYNLFIRFNSNLFNSSLGEMFIK